ncbi:unnamed protein product [Prunus armeniaca]|uniref:Uncharacterized protein n=1 Tax=Prunus armeniaca TaxID=36596 RepID=A0A6J5WG60_PRUAR|nr:unnamed protein product [Prunus armeniaca]
MEGEFGSFIKVWTSVFVCIFYCYSIGKIVPKGTTRLVCALPVVCLFFYLPLNFSSIHLGGGTSFFISWLGSFKLLLFAFGKGPLASDPSISIGRFLAIACLPIEIQENPSPSTSHLNGQNRKNPPQNPQIETNPSPKNTIHISANPPKAHLSPSLLVHIPSSRNPTHHCSSPRLGPSGFRSQTAFQRALPLHLSAKLLGQKMEPRGHQYPTPVRIRTHPQFLHVRHWPQVGLTTRCLCKLPCLRAYARAHILLHGSCEAHVGGHVVLRFARVLFDGGDHLKKALKGSCRLPRLISVVLTVGFVVATCFWLFFPQFLRCKADVRMLQEYRAFVVFLKNAVSIFSYK